MNTLNFTYNINIKDVFNGERQYDSFRMQILKYPSCFLNLNWTWLNKSESGLNHLISEFVYAFWNVLTQSEQFKFRQINKDSECGTRQNNSELLILKRTAILMIIVFYMEDLIKPWILIQVSSKSVENVEVVGVWIFANGLLCHSA